MHWKHLLVIAALSQSTLAMAQACPAPTQLDDILDCLKNSHYLVQLKDHGMRNAENLDQVMGQRPNPVLDVQTVHSSSSRQTQIILSQQLDLGGKLSALRSQGKLLYSLSQTEKAATQEDVIEAVLLNVHHLVHLRETLAVNQQVLASLDTVTGALGRRPVLSPDQEASKVNFELQKAEVNNSIALLEDQEEQVLLFFYLNGGYSKEQILGVMDDHYHRPEISVAASTSFNLMKLGLEVKLAKEELSVQKASIWEGISVGPMYMDDKLDELGSKLYGVAFTMPIPVWQMNGAGKARAQTALANSQRQFELFQKKESAEKDSLVKRIEQLKTSLALIPARAKLAESHRRVEKLYSQGLIPSPIYLDSHRMWRDVTASKLELEERILQLTIEHHRLNGQLNEVHL